jgi:Reverse transcriptase (RNA-dependent DNA polymerase)
VSSSIPSEDPICSQETNETNQMETGTRILREQKEKVDYKGLHNIGKTGKVPDTSRPIISPSMNQREAEEAARNIAIAMLSKQMTLEVGLPNTLEGAKASNEWPKWEQAIQDEMEQLEQLGTWEKTDLPKDRMPIGCRWVFDRKKNKEGEVIKWKAHLVAQGFPQKPGIDYINTFAPVMRLDSLRIFLAQAAINNWEIRQMDIKGAYLWAETKEELYMA